MLIGGLRPPNPLTRSLAGAPEPRSVRVGASLRSAPPALLCRVASLARSPHSSAASLRSTPSALLCRVASLNAFRTPLPRRFAQRLPHSSAASLPSLGVRTPLPRRFAQRLPHSSAASL